ncbi:MAG TPA: hypothetical protein PKE20_12420, partial [Promineifilum sp.]|nr:hypothetical protein [Promineifilum sp.]
MQKHDVPYLVFGILITAIASCRSAIQNNPSITLEPEWNDRAGEIDTASSRESGGAASADPTEAATEPPLPTADGWQLLGSDRTGLTLSIPP